MISCQNRNVKERYCHKLINDNSFLILIIHTNIYFTGKVRRNEFNQSAGDTLLHVTVSSLPVCL